MADLNQFGSLRPKLTGDRRHCSEFEAMLTDAVDGTLTAEEQGVFNLHLLGCAVCSEMLADAKRGAAWMDMLRGQAPEPPAAMVERILARTSGARPADGEVALMGAGPGVAAGTLRMADAGAPVIGNVVPFQRRLPRRVDLAAIGHTLLQPRLAMTAAMAFFSIALTLNLTGVRLSELRASELRPSSLKRSLYEANAHVVRYYTNLRVVYELESRVHELQRSSEEDLPASSSGKDGGTAEPGAKKGQDEGDRPPRRVSPGTSRREPVPSVARVLGVVAGRAPTGGRPDLDSHAGFALLHKQERGTV